MKERVEKPLKEKVYNGDPEEGRLFIICAKANLKLGYLIIAEGMLKNCLKTADQESQVIIEAKTLLAKVYEQQGQLDKAIEYYDLVLAHEELPDD